MFNFCLSNLSTEDFPQETEARSENDNYSIRTVRTSSTDSSSRRFFNRKFFRANETIAASLSIAGTGCGIWTNNALNRYRASEANNPTPPPSTDSAYLPTGNDYLLAETLVAGVMTFGFVVLDIFFISLIALSIYKHRRPPPSEIAIAC